MNNAQSHSPRMNERLQHYWQELRAGRAMPLESEIDMEALKDIWGHCFLVSIHDGKFAYSYLGPDLVDAFGDDWTGKEIVETLVYPHPNSLLNTFASVAQSGEAGMDDSEFVNSRGVTVKYRSCVLPLGAESTPSVAFLLGGMNWKAY
jgi:hypothetical protein